MQLYLLVELYQFDVLKSESMFIYQDSRETEILFFALVLYNSETNLPLA